LKLKYSKQKNASLAFFCFECQGKIFALFDDYLAQLGYADSNIPMPFFIKTTIPSRKFRKPVCPSPRESDINAFCSIAVRSSPKVPRLVLK
jgi:hypothetical protein